MIFQPSSLRGWLTSLPVVACVGLASTWWWSAWTSSVGKVEETHSSALEAVVSTLAPFLDGEQHERLYRELSEKDAVSDWRDAPPPVLAAREVLVRAAEENGLESPVYTLRLRDEVRARVAAAPNEVHKGALELLVTSAEAPYWLHRADYYPEMRTAFFHGTSATKGHYSSRNGEWVSAFAPIETATGEVVAIVEADAPIGSLLAQARIESDRRAAIGLAVFVALMAISWLCATLATAGLARLEAAAGRMAAGDHTTPIEVGSRLREVSNLESAMEDARRRIAAKIEEGERLAADLERSRLEAESANRAKSAFLANTSHELRTPMNAVLACTEMLIDTELDEEQSDLARTIHTSGDALVTVLGDILDFSQIEAGRFTLRAAPMRVRDVLRDAQDLLAHRAREKAWWSSARPRPRCPSSCAETPAACARSCRT